jgi:glycosyltransferase involved in cell wall biosynthesis
MSSAPPALSVVVPAFNEEALLDDAIRRLRRTLDALRLSAEIIIVNDGSRDRTKRHRRHPRARTPRCRRPPSGKPGHRRRLPPRRRARATGDYLILWPADMPADPADLAPYAAEFGRADVIVGVRRARVGYNPLMAFNSWLYPQLVATLFGLRLRDVNWIHAYRRSQFLRINLTQRGIPMLAEALVRLRDLGASFVEVDVEMKVRLGGVASASRLRVMRRTLTGLFSLWWTWRREPRPTLATR